MALVNLKPTQKSVTALIAGAALVFVLCLLSCLWAVGRIRSVDGEKSKVEKQVRESQMVAQTQRSSENKYLDTRAQIRCLESSVSTSAYVPTLLKQIEHLGKSVHLKVLGIRPKAAAPNAGLAKKQAAQAAAQSGGGASGAPVAAVKPDLPKPYDQLDVELELEGDYMNALDFLYKMTSFPKILAVNSVQMSPESGLTKTDNPKLSIKINATAFVFKEASPSKRKSADSAAKAPGDRGTNSLATAPQSLSSSPRRSENALHFPRRTGNEAG